MPEKRYLLLLLPIVALLAACAMDGEVVEVTRRAAETPVATTAVRYLS